MEETKLTSEESPTKQGTHLNDLINGPGEIEGYKKLIYIRKGDELRAKEIKDLGYNLVEGHEDVNSDLDLYGLPGVAGEDEDNSKEMQEAKDGEKQELEDEAEHNHKAATVKKRK